MTGAAQLNADFAAALVDALVAGGVRDAVLSPGSRSTPLALALAERARVHVLVDERAAGFVALGLARAAGAPVALLATSGTAGAHWLPALAEAALGGVPLVALTADRPDDLQQCGAPQTLDQQRLFGTHARWFAHVGPPRPGGPAGWPAAVAARAVDLAVGPPAGPVHLNVALREPLWAPGVVAAPRAAAPRVRRARPVVDAALAGEVAAALAHPRGVVVAGPRALGPSTGRGGPEAEAAAAAVLGLARRLGWPVLADPLSGLRAGRDDAGRDGAGGDDAGAGVVLAADGLLRDPATARALAPAVALRLGQAPTSKATTTWLEASAPRTVLVDPDGQWHDPTHAATLLAVAEPGALCAAVAAALDAAPGPTPAPAWLAAWRAAERAAGRALAAAARDGWWEGAAARAVVEALPAGARLHVASSLAVRDVDAFGGAPAGGVVVTSNRGANGIDGTVATGLGAGLVGAAPVVVLTGDLAFVHDLDGLAAARELGPRAAPLVVVVVDNGGGAIFQQLSVAAHPAFARLFLTPSPHDLAAAAAGLGARVARVEGRAALAEALGAALAPPAGPGPWVLHAVVDRAEGARRRDAAWAAVARALRPTPVNTPDPEPALEEPCPATTP